MRSRSASAHIAANLPNKQSFLALVLCVSSFPAQSLTVPIVESAFSPDATTITFETGSTILPSVPGVRYLQDYNYFSYERGTHWFGGDASFGHRYRVANPEIGQQWFGNYSSSPGYSDLGITFDTPVQAVGGWLGKAVNTTSPDEIEVRVLDSFGNVLNAAVVSLPANAIFDDLLFVGFRSDEGISRIEWRLVGDTTSAGHFGVDNVTFGTAVPLPGAIWLLLSGALAMFRVSIRPKSGQ